MPENNPKSVRIRPDSNQTVWRVRIVFLKFFTPRNNSLRGIFGRLVVFLVQILFGVQDDWGYSLKRNYQTYVE